MDFGCEPPSAQYFPPKSTGVFLPPVLQAARDTHMVLLLEELQPVASADGWTQTATIEQIEQTPR
eukprot:2121107-Prymnesium_polylepis.1